APDVWRRVGMDGKPLRGLPRLPGGGGRRGRIQRQVHERAVRAARRLVRLCAQPPARELPQLLPTRHALAVQRAAPRGGRMKLEVKRRPADIADTLVHGHRRADAHEPSNVRPFAPESEPDADPAFAADVLEGLDEDQKRIPCIWLYDRRGSELFEEITGVAEY